MNIEEILELWDKDSRIDPTDLDDEVLKIPKLHHKYYKLYVNEKLLLRKYESDFKKIKLDKIEFFTQGFNEETPKSWKLPPRGMVLKSDMPLYVDADKDIIDLSLKIGYQQEKIELLESIIKSFQYRGYNIKSAIEHRKFVMGS
jgi:hypothetical protein